MYPPQLSREVPEHVPPMFLTISLDDQLFGMGRPLDLTNDWQASGRPFEAHFYERGGFGLAGNEHLAMAGGLSLAKLQSFAPQMIAGDKRALIQTTFDEL